MNIWKKYQSPLGYYNNDNQIDSYGVNHSHFSTRDELNYQMARQQRENQIIQTCNRQDINKNYPQYTTDFWGRSPDNNYGFGTVNIEIRPDTIQPSYTTESAWGYPDNSQSSFYNKMGRPYNLRPDQYKLGTLSGLYESNNGKKLWNNGNSDKTGGWSYGTYQIATQNGTMNDYLKYLQQHPAYQRFYYSLQRAGGNDTAITGDVQFKNTWADLSKNSDFLQSQQDFMVAKKLDPTLRRISDIKGLDLEDRSPVIRDVLYSTAAQHGEGGAAHVMHRSFGNNTDISTLSDEEIINQIYNERSDVNHHFKSSPQDIKDGVKKRFQNERRKALELLKQYR